jgi:hypothetical protein
MHNNLIAVKLPTKYRGGSGSAAAEPPENAKRRRKGMGWVLGSFIFCPCHLPLTLGLLTAVLTGVGLGTSILQYSIIIGVVVTAIWALGTWYGFRLLRQRTTCATKVRN